MERTALGARTLDLLNDFRDILFRYRPMDETMMTRRRRNLHRYRVPFVYCSQQSMLQEMETLLQSLEKLPAARSRLDGMLRDLLRHQLRFHIRSIRSTTLRFLEVNHLTNPFQDMQWLLSSGWNEYVGASDRFRHRVEEFIKSMREVRHQLRDGAFLGLTLPRRSAVYLMSNLLRLQEWFQNHRPTHELASTVRRMSRTVAESIEGWIQFLRDEYLPRTKEEMGLLHLPGGKESYREILKLHTGRDDLEPEKVERLGRRILRELKAELDRIPSSSLSTNEEVYGTFQEAQQNFEETHARLRRELRDLFPEPPTYANAPIVPVPPEEASGAITAAYDGRVLLSYETLQRSETVGLSLHEHWPGHHLQAEWATYMAQEVHEVLLMMSSNDVVEGWGLYSEGFLPSTAGPVERRALVQANMFRAARLVVDVGIHWYGWGEEKAVRFMQRHLPWMPMLEIRNEVLRYAVIPGQALSYTIGMRCLQGLAKKFPGSVAEFHAYVLRHSFLPCALLEKYMPRKS